MAVLHRFYCIHSYLETWLFICRFGLASPGTGSTGTGKLSTAGSGVNIMISSLKSFFSEYSFRNIIRVSNSLDTGPHSTVGNVSGKRCKSD